MPPPAPFPAPAPGTSPAAPARAAEALTRELTGHGITGIYTATAETFALISVTAAVTVWTNGTLYWCTTGGQHRTWAAADPHAAAASLAALAG
jgi:hypothetical protein